MRLIATGLMTVDRAKLVAMELIHPAGASVVPTASTEVRARLGEVAR